MARVADTKLVEQARVFEGVAWAAVIAVAIQLLFMLGLLHLLGPVYDAILDRDPEVLSAAFPPVLHRLIGFLPALCYIGGLVAAANIFGRVAKGELFSVANARGLADVGSALLWGAAASAIIVPAIRAWTGGADGIGLRLEPETWVIAVIGGALLVLGRMMAQASALQSELEEIV